VEGALQIIDGKAKLVRDDYCDGLGACLGECPTGALTIERREAPEFDEEAVAAATAAAEPPAAPAPTQQPTPRPHGGCPGMQARQFGKGKAATKEEKPRRGGGTRVASELSQWPIQLGLVNPAAPAFQDAHLLLAADCTAFSLGSFHPDLLRGRALIIACPKLDDRTGYVEKLTSLFADAGLRSVTIARMEVPCCGGLVQMVQEARTAADSDLPVEIVTVGIEGDILDRDLLQ
jgi:ferredoxin